MRYVEELLDGHMKSLTEMFSKAIAENIVSEEDFRRALEAESEKLAPGSNVHQLSMHSEALIAKIMKSPDRNMLIILKKILKSTRYAVITYHSVIDAKQNKSTAASL